ncbi:PAS domain S-box protein [Altererythrobacter aestuarii]|uniref:histidine kinase n=1 Tax=Alteraurantiacibacter aestuarii TaxID=650004 RepID=A0A844ZJ83_9SPHN|nr:PAS domain S-box protein [Alteraurantiacibacter aestuarii]
MSDFYAALVESTDDAIVAKDVNGTVLSWNPAAVRLFGYSEAEMVGQSIVQLLPDDRLDEEVNILTRIRAGERVGQFFTKRRHKSGRLIDVSVTVSPVHDKDGNVVGASKIARDATQVLERERRLRQSEARFHMLADNIAPFAWIAEPSGNIIWYNKRWYDYTGTTLEDMRGWGWTKVHHPDHVDRVREHIKSCFESGEEWEDTFPLRSKEGEYRWFLSRAKPIREEHGNIIWWFGTNTDITEQREQAEQIRLLLMEVNHRSKNMLSTIQALIRRSVKDNDGFIARFQDRIRSLAVNQDILVRREWREVPVEELARLQLAFVMDAPGEITISGSEFPLNPRAAEIIGMALHELATNSLKYGALSAGGGQVSIGWEVDEEGGLFSMHWTESGGPQVTAPEQTGFGSTLIAEVPRRFFGGEAGIDYASSGISWSLKAPLAMIRAGLSQSAATN